MPRYKEPPRLDRLKVNGKPTGKWYILWNDGRDRRRSTRTDDRAAAEAKLKRFSPDDAEEYDEPPGPDAYTVGEAFAFYLKEHLGLDPVDDPEFKDCNENIPDVARRVAKLLDFFGAGTRLIFVTTKRVKAYAKMRRKEGPERRPARLMSDSTIATELSLLRAAVNYSVLHSKLTRAPFIPLPSPAPERDIWFESWEIDLLIDECRGEHLQLFIEFGLATAARKGAILDAQWGSGQIDFERRRVFLNPRTRKQTTKWRAKVPMTDDLRDTLLAAKSTARTPYLIEHPRAKGGRLLDIKTGFKNACWRVRRRLLQEARQLPIGAQRRQALLESAIKFRKATPHTLRHTAGTWMAQAGKALEKIAAIMGISDLEVVRKYAHHHPDFLHDEAEAIAKRRRAYKARPARSRPEPLKAPHEAPLLPRVSDRAEPPPREVTISPRTRRVATLIDPQALAEEFFAPDSPASSEELDRRWHSPQRKLADALTRMRVGDGYGGERWLKRAEMEGLLIMTLGIPRDSAQSAATKAVERAAPDDASRRTHRKPIARRVNGELKNQMRCLRDLGKTQRAIADELGCDVKTVRTHLR
jgi:integrase